MPSFFTRMLEWFRIREDNRRVLREHQEEARLEEERRHARKGQWLREQRADEHRERELLERLKRREEAANRLKERRKHREEAAHWALDQEGVSEEEYQRAAQHRGRERQQERKRREEATHWARYQERVAEEERNRAEEDREHERQQERKRAEEDREHERKRREEATNRAQHQKRAAEEVHRRRIEALLRRDAVRDEINYMSGAEFEMFMADLFRKKGYDVQETRTSGDQGVDLVLPDVEGKRVAVQLKRWTGPVGNRAVQATFAGMAHYQAEDGWIITTGTFTKSARDLARSTRVRLIDGKELAGWLEGLREQE